MKKYIVAMVLGVSVMFSGTALAAEEIGDNTASDVTSSDDWFYKPKGSQAANARRKAADKEAASRERFQELFADGSYTYYMDTKNAQWIPMPHSGNEYIADVWVKLVQKEGSADYSYPPKYFLEHYYIRPSTKQIQFLSELEVTGRPDNAIKERAYSVQNWENLVPGSLEDDIYHEVLKRMKKNRLGGNSSNGMSFRDTVEEYLRISL